MMLGRSNSGKSWFAERQAARMARGRLLYVATMVAVDEEGAARIARHRKQREGLGFTTHELPTGITAVEAAPEDTVLLEDVSNLLANHLFGGENAGLAEALAEIEALAARCDNLLAVSFYGLHQSDEYDEGTNRYIAELDRINGLLEARADVVVMMENGEPVVKKGVLPQQGMVLDEKRV